jgi:hypothetical protein
LPQARDFLDRFRPAGAPGAASRAGVPADRAAELATELEPVLALLDGAYAECGRIIDAAQQDAEQIAEQDREEAAAIATEAKQRARAAQDAAVEHVLAAACAEAEEAVRSAAARADRRRAAFADGRADRLATLAVGLLRARPTGNTVSERGTP